MNYFEEKKFIYGSYQYEYKLLRENRKTLSLTVTPDLQIFVKSPFKADDDRIEVFLKRKWLWLQKQLRFFSQFNNQIYKREFISGESFYYLGRQYKLMVRQSVCDNVSFSKRIIHLSTTRSVDDGQYNKKLLNQWYKEKMDKVFAERFEEIKKWFNYKKMPQMSIRKMQKRWGSFLNNEKIFLNPKLICTSTDCIDYVIMHELCHMKHKNHNNKFFSLLKEKYPSWKKVKGKLESYQQ